MRGFESQSVVAWVLPALLYAAASDRLIAVVRRRALARRLPPTQVHISGHADLFDTWLANTKI